MFQTQKKQQVYSMDNRQLSMNSLTYSPQTLLLSLLFPLSSIQHYAHEVKYFDATVAVAVNNLGR